MSRMMCPHCGWTYDPSINGEGYSLVPNHWFKAVDCPGQGQHPRNAESDKRPLWREEQTVAAMQVTLETRQVLQAELDRAVKRVRELESGAALSGYAMDAVTRIANSWGEWDAEARQAAQQDQDERSYKFVLKTKLATCLWESFKWQLHEETIP
jgi:hypothetical protein